MRRLPSSLLVVLVVCGLLAPGVAAQASPAPGSFSLRADGRWMLDWHGRTVLLHGVNVVDKRPPYVPGPAELNDADARLMRKLGFNVVRLGIIWKGLEPTRGHYDETYIRRLRQIVQMLGRHGIYTLLDFHQDVWNEKYGGEGAPDWAVLDDGLWTGLEPNVFSGWASRYFTPGVQRAFDNFWEDRDGIQQAYVAAWAHVAQAFAYDENVIGYDLINEPWPGSMWEAFQTPLAETLRLQPFYERAITAIRAVDYYHTIWYEPSVATDFGAANGLGQMRPIAGDNLGMSFHIYCLTGETVVPNGSNNSESCEFLEDRAWGEHTTTRDRNDDAWMLSEFGATDDLVDISSRLDQADEHLVGWMYWSWKYLDDPTGAVNEGLVEKDTGEPVLKGAKADALSRPYAQAISGRPLDMSFDPETRRFELRFAVVPTYDLRLQLPDYPYGRPTSFGVSDIFIPVSRHYPHGYQVQLTGAARVISRPDATTLRLRNTGGGFVTVVVLPR